MFAYNMNTQSMNIDYAPTKRIFLYILHVEIKIKGIFQTRYVGVYVCVNILKIHKHRVGTAYLNI